MSPQQYNMSRELFVVLRDLKSRFDRYHDRIQPMSDAPAATVIANVNTFYQEDHDLALICLTFDAGKFDPFNFETLVHLGTEAGFSVIDPERFSDNDRGFFYQDYLRRFAIVATNLRTPIGALEAAGKQLGVYSGEVRRDQKVGDSAEPQSQRAFVPSRRMGSDAEPLQDLPPTERIPIRTQMDNLQRAREGGDAQGLSKSGGRFDQESGVESHISVVVTPPLESQFDVHSSTRAVSPNALPTKQVDAEEYQEVQDQAFVSVDLASLGFGPAGNEQARGKNRQSQRLPTVPATPGALPGTGSGVKFALPARAPSEEPVPEPERKQKRLSSAPLFNPAGEQELVRVRYQRGDTWMPGRLRNLTTKDIRLAASSAPPEGSILRVSVTIGDLNAVLTGTVVEVVNTEGSADGSTTFRCEFRRVGKHEHDRLVALLRQAKKRGMSLTPPPPRRGRRFAISWPLAVKQDAHRFNASALDISEHGLFLSTNTLLRSNQILFGLPLDRPDTFVRGRAKIARKVSEHMARTRGLNLGYGLEIEGFHVQDQKPYAEFLERVKSRSQRHVLVAGEGARTLALAEGLRAAGYAVSKAASVEIMMHRTQFESNAPDVAMMDSGSLSVDAQLGFQTIFREYSVPLLLAGTDAPDVARDKLDQMVEI